jgi:cell division protein FtsB
VCLCGSGRFREAFERAEFEETLAGKIVLTIGCNTKDVARSANLAHHKAALDELHLRKIDLADEVLILNVGGYIGDSTRRELEYSRQRGKQIRFLEPQHLVAT